MVFDYFEYAKKFNHILSIFNTIKGLSNAEKILRDRRVIQLIGIAVGQILRLKM